MNGSVVHLLMFGRPVGQTRIYVGTNAQKEQSSTSDRTSGSSAFIPFAEETKAQESNWLAW